MHKKILVALVLKISVASLALAGPPVIFGGWNLTEFSVISPQGKAQPFCGRSTGQILYEKSGHMSVSINCLARRLNREPADKYGRIFFYAGSFSINDKNEVTHKITNASSAALIGAQSVRKIEKLDDENLVLTGKFGTEGDTLRISWTKLPNSPAPAVAAPAPEGDLAKAPFAMLTLLKVKRGQEEAFKKEIATIVAPSHSEPDNIAWYVQQSQTDSTEFVFYTRWKNQAALDAHLASPPLARYLERTGPMLEPGNLQLVKYWPVDL